MEKKAHRGIIWKVMGSEQFIRGVWQYSTLKRSEVKKILDDASRERQEGIQGQWQKESPCREVLEQVRGNADVGCASQMMRQGNLARRNGSWERANRKKQEIGNVIGMNPRKNTRSFRESGKG